MDSEVVRGKPLTKDETKLLLGLIESSPIILSKTTNAASNKMKNEEWVSLTHKFNATASFCRRSPQQLRLKWENLKKLARKRSTKIRMNRIQTGGGIPEYIPPDDILDRVADLLGSTASGFVVPFGGDKEEGVFVCTGDGGGGGDGGSGGDGAGQARVLPVESIPVLVDTGIGTTMPVTVYDTNSTSFPLSIVNGTLISEKPIDNATNHEASKLHTPKRLTLSSPKIGKKKLKSTDGSSSARNLAIAEYYTAKKQCLDAKKEFILLQNEKLKLEIEKLRGGQ
ncbi:unnamed protein product [Colias eurytheme]|nr:unnamed protein product [Colias eurytheme]